MNATPTIETDRTGIAEAVATIRHLLDRDRTRPVRQFDLDLRVQACARWALAGERPEKLAAMTVVETRMGDAADLAAVFRRRVHGVLADLHGRASTGVLSEDPDTGLTTLSRPRGVIALVTPATAPASAIATSTLTALKAGNGVVISPHPATRHTARRLVTGFRDSLRSVGQPEDLVVLVDGLDRDGVGALMTEADFVVATGGPGTVRRAYASGTPAISSGAGNPTVIVDERADVPAAAAAIAHGAATNHGTSCSSESNVLVHADVADALRDGLRAADAHICDAEESHAVIDALWPRGVRRGELVGRPPGEILAAAGIHDADPAGPIVLTGTALAPGTAALTEKLTPVMTLRTVPTFDAAVPLADATLTLAGSGHSCGLHTSDDAIGTERALLLAGVLPVSRVLVNQSTIGNAGAPHNAMPYTSVVATGSWGGCATSHNATLGDFLQKIVVSRPKRRTTPPDHELFALVDAFTGTPP